MLKVVLKNEITLSIGILLCFLAGLWLTTPIKELLLRFFTDEYIAKYSVGITVRGSMAVAVFILMKKLKLLSFAGIDDWRKIKNHQALAIPLILIASGIASNWQIYVGAEVLRLLLFILSVLAVGCLEELVFRGTILPLFIRAFRHRKRPILVSAILSSLMFGVVHFFNLFSQPENITGITKQVFFALSIGVFFSGLMVRTENILMPILIHAMVNLAFGAGELVQAYEATAAASENNSANWTSVIPTLAFFSFIFLGGWYMMMKSSDEAFLERLPKSA